MSEQLIKEILGEVKNLNRRFDSMAEDQSKIVLKLENLDSKVDGLESSVVKLSSQVDTLETTVGKLESKVDGLEAGQLKLETRIENEVIDKLRILFDAHSLYMDYSFKVL